MAGLCRLANRMDWYLHQYVGLLETRILVTIIVRVGARSDRGEAKQLLVMLVRRLRRFVRANVLLEVRVKR